MEATLAPVDAPLIAALRLDGPLRIAELGCGGGATTLQILEHAESGSSIDAFDISPAVVAAARAKLRPNQGGVAFHLADIGQAPLPQAPYQRLTSRFGIMFFDDPAATFGKLLHWLAPAGRFAFAVWGPPSQNLWMKTVRDVVASIIELPQVLPDAPGPFRYGEVDALLGLLQHAGFVDVAAEQWRGTLPVGGGLPAAPAARFALAAMSSFAELLAQAGQAQLQVAQLAVSERYAEFEQDGVVRAAACVHLVTGERPA